MGITTCIVWILKGAELSFAIERMVTVMVICCPHALGLAVPLVAAISTSISAKQGILIRIELHLKIHVKYQQWYLIKQER